MAMVKKVMKKAQNGDTVKRAARTNLWEQKMQDDSKLRKPSYDKAAADSVRAKANEAAPKPKPKKSIYSLYDSPSFAPTGPRPKKKNGGAIVKTKKK
jgi:hypothetical protein